METEEKLEIVLTLSELRVNSPYGHKGITAFPVADTYVLIELPRVNFFGKELWTYRGEAKVLTQLGARELTKAAHGFVFSEETEGGDF